MNRFHHPGEHEIKKSQQEVIASLETSGLDRSSTVILGGSALALAGIRPARDIDVMVPGYVFKGLRKAQRTPGGLPLRAKPDAHHPFLVTTHDPDRSNVLPFDITHPHDDVHHLASPTLDQTFLNELRLLPAVDGFRYLPADLVAAHKAELGRPKDRRDLRLIRKHLK